MSDCWVEPIVFTDEETIEAFADLLCDIHTDIEAGSRCLGVSGSVVIEEKTRGSIAGVVDSVFGVHFGSTPIDRFSDIFAQAAHLASHIALDHIFLDGNKRTALMSALLLLRLKDVKIDYGDAPQPEDNIVYGWIELVVSREKTEEELADELRRRML